MATWKLLYRSVITSKLVQVTIIVISVLAVYLFYSLSNKSNFSTVADRYHDEDSVNTPESDRQIIINKDVLLSVSDGSSETLRENASHQSQYIDVFITFTNAEHNYKFQEKFKMTVKSMLRFATIPINLHIVGDNKSEEIATRIINEVPGSAVYKMRHLKIDELNRQVQSSLTELQPFFSSQGAYFSDPLFFLSIVIHRVLPNHHRIIMLDADLKFNADIRELYKMFDYFSDDNVMGLSHELQPVYRHILHMYRNKNKGTRVGDPPPNGLNGFNTGVVLLDLDRMRQSKLYNSYISKEAVQALVDKYLFKGHLGDQDFYSLINLENERLFYVLPCTWNRQLCQWWRNHGYQTVFDEYFSCEGHINIYHGNCDTVIPTLDWETAEP